MGDIVIRDALNKDAARLAEIYNYYIRETVVTFEMDEIDAKEMTRRMNAFAPYPWLVAEDASGIIGYAYSHKFRERKAYQYSADLSIYMDPGNHRKGVGSQLYTELIKRLKQTDTAMLVAALTVPNEASERLHSNLGFTKTAQIQRVGFKHGRWIDVAFWQLQIKPDEWKPGASAECGMRSAE